MNIVYIHCTVGTSNVSSFFPKGFVILPLTWAIKDIKKLCFPPRFHIFPSDDAKNTRGHADTARVHAPLLHLNRECSVVFNNKGHHTVVRSSTYPFAPRHLQASEEDIQDINKETDDTGGPGRGHHRGQHAQDGGDPRCIHCAPWSQAGRGSEKTSI